MTLKTPFVTATSCFTLVTVSIKLILDRVIIPVLSERLFKLLRYPGVVPKFTIASPILVLSVEMFPFIYNKVPIESVEKKLAVPFTVKLLMGQYPEN